MVERVIPQALNYGDIKPEAMENQLRVVKFTPVATVQQVQPNEVIQFRLQGNGFMDPFSTYIKVTVNVPYEPLVDADTGAGNVTGKFLDRSAHSLFNRLVIRSQGTELERIDEYDVCTAMLNDVHYSSEQNINHHYEGFPKSELSVAPELAGGAEGFLNNFGNIGRMFSDLLPNSPVADARNSSDQFFGEIQYQKTTATLIEDVNDNHFAMPQTYAPRDIGADEPEEPNYFQIPDEAVAGESKIETGYQRTFCIPIYSGILGVLMPDKKLLPLSLLPLEVEFTVNPYAFYTCGTLQTSRAFTITRMEIWAHMFFFEQNVHRALEAAVAEAGLFIHFNSFRLAPITTNTGGENTSITSFSQINVHDKSINSIHFVFLYTLYQTQLDARKLHFVSHNLQSLQIRNGTELTPSEPIITTRTEGNHLYAHAQYLIEMYKAYNKMHMPSLDSGITPFNYQQDRVWQMRATSKETGVNRIAPSLSVHWSDIVIQNARVGRCQYALSLEGEQLGANKMIISGKQGMIPFDINQVGVKSAASNSYQLIFVRADYVLYIRPDLVVTLLGR